MKMKKNTKLVKVRIISSVLCVVNLLMTMSINNFAITETPENIFEGNENANALIKNMDYKDLKSGNLWAKDAIYEASALDIMKGYGDKYFGRSNTLTKDQAIATLYRLIGKEANAQQAGLTNIASSTTTTPIRVWSDGFLRLAAQDGLITTTDLNVALASTTSSTIDTPGSFNRNAPVKRQEFANWIAKILKFVPQYTQQNIFNSFNDWNKIDVEKIPYVESVLQKHIMNGDGNGSFRPNGALTREEAAQVLTNAILDANKINGYQKKTGTIEDTQKNKEIEVDTTKYPKFVLIRNSNGKLDVITTESITASNSNEVTGYNVGIVKKEVVVLKNGIVGDSNLLKASDKVEYIIDNNKKVKFIKVISNIANNKFFVGELSSIDSVNSKVTFSKAAQLSSGSLNSDAMYNTFKDYGVKSDSTYKYSNSATMSLRGNKVLPSELTLGGVYFVRLQNDMIYEMKDLNLDRVFMDTNIINGIIDEIGDNYIKVYKFPIESYLNSNNAIKTYYFTGDSLTKIMKNGVETDLNDIEVGNKVLMKLDYSQKISELSANSGYESKYAKVLQKGKNILIVKFDDGTEADLDIDEKVEVYEKDKPSNLSNIKDGDYVKLLVNVTPKETKIKRITTSDEWKFVSKVYKGLIRSYNDISDVLMLDNLESFKNGTWYKADNKGFSPYILDKDTRVFIDGTLIDNNEEINLKGKGKTAYMVVESGFNGEETPVMISIRNEKPEDLKIFEDEVKNAGIPTGSLSLTKLDNVINTDISTIVVKDGRLVQESSIKASDLAFVSTNLNANGNTYANIIDISKKVRPYQLLWTTVSAIKDNVEFKVNGYSRLDGDKWTLITTPTAFKLSNNTRLVDTTGVESIRNFTSLGSSNYIDKSMYLLFDGVYAYELNVQPFADNVYKGEIYQIGDSSTSGSSIGATTGSSVGATSSPAITFNLIKSSQLNNTTNLWLTLGQASVTVDENTIIINKYGKRVAPDAVKKADRVKIITNVNSLPSKAQILYIE